MDEEVEKQGTPVWTLVKAVCKKWLLIGFCAIFGGLIACGYAILSQPLTKDVYQTTIYLNQTNVGTEKDIVFYNDNNLNNIREYFRGPEFRYHVYLAVKDDAVVFKGVAEKDKETKFKTMVSVSVGQAATVFILDQTEETAKIILTAFAEQALHYVDAMMESMAVEFEGKDIMKIAAFSGALKGEIVKADPKQTTIEGYVGAKNRLTTVIMGAVIGIVIGAAVALCIYYFNNRVNSTHTLAAMGFPAVFAVKNGRGKDKDKDKRTAAAVLAQNALRYPFAIEKQGCRVVTFISPEKTDETRKALESQAEILRGRGYRALLLQQGKQTRDEWKELIDKNLAENDFILIDAAAGDGFDCAAPAAFGDGVTVIIDQKRTKLQAMKHTKEILDAAKLNALSAVVVNTKDDFVS